MHSVIISPTRTIRRNFPEILYSTFAYTDTFFYQFNGFIVLYAEMLHESCNTGLICSSFDKISTSVQKTEILKKHNQRSVRKVLDSPR
jgi:hypothetical protein